MRCVRQHVTEAREKMAVIEVGRVLSTNPIQREMMLLQISHFSLIRRAV